MIKKFEEFVNESASYSVSNNESWTKQEYEYLKNRLGNYYGNLTRKINGYSFEEISDILDRLGIPDAEYIKARHYHLLKQLLSDDITIEEKQKVLDYFCKKENGGIPFPIVIDINGKLITGEVYYCEALDAYAKDEDDFIEDGYAWLEKKCAEEGIYDDGRTDGLNDYWDWLNIDTVNLDEEYFDREQNIWVKRK